MRQEGYYCGKSKAVPFWRRRAGFLFLFVHYFLDLIANSISVLSATVRGSVINTFLFMRSI